MKENISVTKREKALAIGTIIVALIVFIGVGFAFFSASVSNANHETVSTETSTLSLKFEDGDNGISGVLNLGESITKKFTLENTGTLDAYAKINWYNLVNTYMNGSLTFTLEQSDADDGTYTSIGNGNVPVSSTETTETLKNGILVPVNTTYYYKLTITFNNLENVNQNSDINANFHSFFSLEEGSLSASDKLIELVGNADPSSTDVITKETPSGATCTNTLAYDGTVDNNLRYVGANPCNYVSFNNETWRIIGVMNNVDDGTGKKETRIKLVRNDSLGKYSWDSSASGVNAGYGVNDWTQADLMRELNGDYLNTNLTANTMWYNGYQNQKTGEFDITKRLKATAQAQIGDAKWHLGGMKYENNDLIPSTMYTKERGTEVVIPGTTCSGTNCNDGITRATEWTGKVALIYPSDYGYATAGGQTTNRATCIGTLSIMYDNSGETWKNSSYSNCKDNNWITYQWALSPGSNNSRYAFSVDSGSVYSYDTNGATPVAPAVYLKSSVTISGGNGTQSEPYVLE